MDGKGVNAQPAWDISKILKLTANSWLSEEARQWHCRQQATSDLWFRVREYDGIISYLLCLDLERTVRYIPIVHIHGLTESGWKAQLRTVLFELLRNQSMAEAAGPNSGDKPMPVWTGPISTGEYGYPALCSQIKWEQTLTLFCCSLALVRWLYDKPGLFLEGAREEPLVMEKQQPAKASLQFHCGEWKKKKRITLGVEKLRRVWDGSCISGQKKNIYIRMMETWTGCCGFSPDRKSQPVSCLLADSLLNGSNLY